MACEFFPRDSHSPSCFDFGAEVGRSGEARLLTLIGRLETLAFGCCCL